jgi:hypothetical protein
MAGCSGTPLAAKLGIREQCEVVLIGAPEGYHELLQPLPASVRFAAKPSASSTIVQVFTTKRADLSEALASYRAVLSPQAAVWVSWPKKLARVSLAVHLTKGVCNGNASRQSISRHGLEFQLKTARTSRQPGVLTLLPALAPAAARTDCTNPGGLRYRRCMRKST